MEQFAVQPENQRVPFSSENERGTKQKTHVQASSPKTQSQLDYLQTQSTTALRGVRRKEGRVRKIEVGGNRKEGRIL